MSAVYTCITCFQPVDYLEVFPGPRCLICHAAAWDRQTDRQKLAAFDNLANSFRNSVNL